MGFLSVPPWDSPDSIPSFSDTVLTVLFSMFPPLPTTPQSETREGLLQRTLVREGPDPEPYTPFSFSLSRQSDSPRGNGLGNLEGLAVPRAARAIHVSRMTSHGLGSAR